jgi:hypothetical protein
MLVKEFYLILFIYDLVLLDHTFEIIKRKKVLSKDVSVYI